MRDAVNAGNSFDGIYFLQTCDLNLEHEAPWEPIGLFGSGNYFYGIYDGGAHWISNLICYTVPGDTVANMGLFGQLGGQVRNLGIESGSIEGSYVGGITSHSIGNDVVIINCYNRASVAGGGRAGGICDNLSGGIVVNCANYGEVTGKQTGQIVSYSAKNVINVYPEKGAVSDDFRGSVSNYIAMDEENVFDLLNSGIDYLEREESFSGYGIRTCIHNRRTPSERVFSRHTASISLEIRQDSCGKFPCLTAKGSRRKPAKRLRWEEEEQRNE